MKHGDDTPAAEPSGEALSRLASRLDDAEDYLDDVEARLDVIEGANIEARLEEIERRLDVAFSLRLDWLERDVCSLKEGLDSHLAAHYGPPLPAGRRAASAPEADR